MASHPYPTAGRPVAFVIAWSPQGTVPPVLPDDDRQHRDGPLAVYFQIPGGHWTTDPRRARRFGCRLHARAVRFLQALPPERYPIVALVSPGQEVTCSS